MKLTIPTPPKTINPEQIKSESILNIAKRNEIQSVRDIIETNPFSLVAESIIKTENEILQQKQKANERLIELVGTTDLTNIKQR